MEKTTNIKQTAHIAGMLYFAFLLLAPLGYMYLPTEIVKSNDAIQTVKNILDHESLFRWGILLTIVGQILFIFLALQLHKLFKDVSKKWTDIMVVLVVAAVSIAILNEVFYVGALHVLKNLDSYKAFNLEQINSLVLLMTNLRNYGTIIAGFFWGLWLFPFGHLMIKSNFMPKVLGYLLILGGVCYILDSSFAILMPNFREDITNILLLPLSIGEIGTIFYLLIKGIKSSKIEK